VAAELQKKYRSLGSDYSSAIVEQAFEKQYVSSEGKMVKELGFFVKLGSEIIKQSLSQEEVKSALQNLQLSSGETIEIYEEQDGVNLYDYEKTFKNLFSERIRNEDIQKIEEAVKKKIAEKAGPGVSESDVTVDLLKIEEVLTTGTDAGTTLHQAVFGAKEGDSILDARLIGQLSADEMRSALSSITISGTSDKYDSLVVDGSTTEVEPKSNLGQITLEQLCQVSQYSEFEDILQETISEIKSLSEGDAECTVIAQEEMIVLKEDSSVSSSVYTLYFESSVEEVDYHSQEFTSKVQQKLTAKKDSLKTSKGEAYTLSSALSSEIYKKDASFRIDLTTTLMTSHMENFRSAIETAYENKYSKDAAVKLTLQEELITATKETIWRLHFFISVDGIQLDGRVDEFLTEQEIRTALRTVTLSGSQKYDSVFVTSSEETYEYESRFSILLENEVTEGDFASFETALKDTLEAEIDEFDSKNIEVKVLKVEEIVDAAGKFFYDVSYFVKADGEPVDGRTVVGLSSDQINNMITSKSLTMGNGESYKAAENVVQPTKRVEYSLSKAFLVKGLLPESSYADFQTAIEEAYSSVSGLENVNCEIVSQDTYIIDGEYATSLVAFLDVEGVQVNPSTVSEVSFSDIEDEVDFTSPTTGEDFELIEVTNENDLLPAKNAFKVILNTTVQAADESQILISLKNEYKKIYTSEASSLDVVKGKQEKIFVTDENDNKNSLWEKTYFVTTSSGVVNSEIVEQLPASAVQSAFDKEITGTNGK
jgi:hypothetical protein